MRSTSHNIHVADGSPTEFLLTLSVGSRVSLRFHNEKFFYTLFIVQLTSPNFIKNWHK